MHLRYTRRRLNHHRGHRGRSVVSWIILCTSGVLCAETHFASIDGLRVHYESYGAGREALVLIHGWTCDLTFWRLQAPVYEKRRSLLIDLPGHGRSDQPDLPYTLDLFGRAVEAVLRDAGVDRAVLTGHSMGTPVALTFLKLFPRKASGLVVVDYSPPTLHELPGIAERYAVRGKEYRGPGHEAARGKAIDSMFVAHTPEPLRVEIRAKMLAAPQHVAASALEGMGAVVSLLESKPRFDVPALVILAKRPGRGGREYEAYLRGLFPQLSYQEWEGAGHFLMMEQPDRFNRVLQEWLQKR